MRTPISSPRTRLIAAAISYACLTACGGGNAAAPSVAPAIAAGPATIAEQPAPAAPVQAVAENDQTPAIAATFTAVPSGVAPATPGTVITNLTLVSTSSTAQSNLPLTFGQVFSKGDVAPNMQMTGVLADGTTIALQVDGKATHADGSLRHAVISAVVPKLMAGQSTVMSLARTNVATKAQSNTPAALLGAGFGADATITLGGQKYTASADALLRAGKYTTWLSGAMVNEWHVSAPLTTEAGVQHPHLSARFAIRSYTGQNRARVDVTLENSWAYEPNPSNFTYDAVISVGGKPAYEKLALTHLTHARWRKVLWWGGEPQIHIKHNVGYLISSRAVPNYDQTLTFKEGTLNAIKTQFSGAAIEPMGSGMALPYMPATGGRPEIGLLPGWAVTYLLTMDKRAKDATLGSADLAGSWASHYRDKATDRPITLIDYPYMTIIDPNVGDTYNPATKKLEAFPKCAAGACNLPNEFDGSHQPGFAYLPYLVTGDYYYLEELQFWGMANSFFGHPGYRENVKGLVHPEQVRGQAWDLRTLAEVAYITPDADRLKAHFESFLTANLDWYNAAYAKNPSANTLGVVLENAFAYDNGTGIAPWQDDFFTSALGHALELGFTKAAPMLAWKAKFPIMRMTGVGACWIDASIYSMVIKGAANGPIFDDISLAYNASHTPAFSAFPCGSPQMAASLGLKVGEMTGYSDSTVGMPSDMQPALAYSADAVPNAGAAAWKQFMARSIKPDYSTGPQFAIVPR